MLSDFIFLFQVLHKVHHVFTQTVLVKHNSTYHRIQAKPNSYLPQPKHKVVYQYNMKF